MNHLVHQHGDWFYALTLLLTFLEGETFLLLAAAASVGGVLDPLKLGLCAWVGSCLGDQCWFFMGRWFGPVLLRRWPKVRAKIATVQLSIERWETAFILTFRFMYGIRNFSSVALGLSRVRAGRFIVLNAIAAAIWSVVFVCIGVMFGKSMGALLGARAGCVEIGIAVIFVAIVAINGWRHWRSTGQADVSIP